MSTLKDLRIRQSAVQSIYKMTSAMKSVAAAKLIRAQDMLKKSIQNEKILEMWAQRALSDIKKTPFWFKAQENKSRLIIVIGPEHGFCGSLTHRTVGEALEKSHPDSEIVFLGQKGADLFLRRSEKSPVFRVNKPSRDGFSNDDILFLEDLCFQSVQNGKSCWVLYPTFRSSLNQELVFKQILPFSMDAHSQNSTIALNDGSKKDGIISYKPSPELFLDGLLPQLFRSRFLTLLWESFASEQSARLIAMKDSSQNAQDLLEDLKMRYNRTRQGKITLELIEIISGAEHA